MNIALLRTLPIGHAVELVVSLDPGTMAWHVLRRTDDDFPVDPLDDTNSVVIHVEQCAPTDHARQIPVLDLKDVRHGQPYWYIAYGYDGLQWRGASPQPFTPQPHAHVRSIDPLTLLRDRLIVGLQDAVIAGRLKPASGNLPVLTAPPQTDTTTWPLVTLHLETDTAAERAIGEQIDQDYRRLTDGDWQETEGWLSRIEISVVGWSQNPDERSVLRQELKHLIIGNLPVFAALGLITPDWNQRDSEDFTTYNAPVYQTAGAFSCLVPSALTWTVPDITAITVSTSYD